MNPELEASGLATRFSLTLSTASAQSVGNLVGRMAPQGGWMKAWMTRLPYITPWLAGLAAAGAAWKFADDGGQN